MRRVAAAAVIALMGCGGADTDDTMVQDTGAVTPAESQLPNRDTIRVSFIDSAGQDAGTAQLIRQPSGVEIAVRVTGLTPGEHGFHVHETGRCDAPSFESAGGHYSPEARQHGLQNPQGPHAGDLPGLRANEAGVADTVFTVDRLTLDAGSGASLLQPGGLALMVHADPDDNRTDPSGNSGARVACAVIAAQ